MSETRLEHFQFTQAVVVLARWRDSRRREPDLAASSSDMDHHEAGRAQKLVTLRATTQPCLGPYEIH